ncbi:hypothetical protein [Streptomyces racemochromogenes]|uniref:hypothetical protein n=1 Tax=Streptomyces racemochromogenes TaxID=67353 RepID=UPI0035E656EE
MSEQNQQQPAAGSAFEHLVQTLTEVSQNPWAPGADERLSNAAYAANAEMYPKSNGS